MKNGDLTKKYKSKLKQLATMVNKVLIGSSAIKHHFPDFNREPKDLDYAVRDKKIPGTDSMVIPLVIENSSSEIATPEMLLTLKLSHIFWNELGERNWEKHMWDIQFLLHKGVDYDREQMLQLKEFWTEHYGGLRRSKLNMSAEEFFDNAINVDIDHDHIHTLIHPDPIYKKVLEDGAEVNLDPDKFFALTGAEKDRFIQEEVMVMAWERFPKYYYKKAYYVMYKKFLRNHVPMFAFDYMVRNWIRLGQPSFNFIEKINKNLVYELSN